MWMALYQQLCGDKTSPNHILILYKIIQTPELNHKVLSEYIQINAAHLHSNKHTHFDNIL